MAQTRFHSAQPTLALRSHDLSVVIPAFGESENLALLLPGLRAELDQLGITYELLIVTPGPDPEAGRVATRFGAVVVPQTERGYGGALLAGFAGAGGRYVLTMDADLSHRPTFVSDLWQARHTAEVLVASRYVAGGKADMPVSRRVLSRILNAVFARALDLHVRDMSSGFRLYRADILPAAALVARDFDILQELLVRIYAEGWQVRELPFSYAARGDGRSHAKIIKFGLAYVRTLRSLWIMRNSILAGDYDDRAYDSIIPLQRYWQRSRYRHVTELLNGRGPVLDVGCGSSRIIRSLSDDSIAVDILPRKLRSARKFGKALVCASGFALPFADASFPYVLCSQVIEHLPKDSPILDELVRVLAPGGLLVLGTPDYDTWQWVTLEKLYGRFAPGGYADEHITHYTRAELLRIFVERGFELEETRYIMHGELIMALRKGH